MIGGTNVLSEEFSKVYAGPVGKLLELGSAGESVSQNYGV
jgi:hypothetical protein